MLMTKDSRLFLACSVARLSLSIFVRAASLSLLTAVSDRRGIPGRKPRVSAIVQNQEHVLQGKVSSLESGPHFTDRSLEL